jgi:HSP20 family molecular chaperone IbpA
MSLELFDADDLFERNSVATLNKRLSDLFFPRLNRQFVEPLLDIRETDNEYIINVDLPGIDKSNIDISISGNMMTISCEREEQKENRKSYYSERSFKSYKRSFTIPTNINYDLVDEATYINGVLTITLPKNNISKSKKIKIN